MKKILSLLIVAFALLFSTSFAYADYPKPTGYVNDYANVLSPGFEASEEKKLTAYTKQTTNEIAVVTVNTTGDTTIEDYGQGLADQWKPGVSGKDNGIIILFAMQDHHDRIQIGCGLEGAFTDVQAQAILDNSTQPLMRAGKYDQAVDTTVTDVENQIKGATLSPCTVGSQKAIDQARANTATSSKASSDSGGGLGSLLAIIFVFILIIIVVSIALDETNGFGSGFTAGTLFGGIGEALLDGDSDSGGGFGSGGGGFGGFSGGSFSGGGASGSW